MRHSPDEDGRYPLDSKEYAALCCVIGTLHTLLCNKDELKDRLSLVPNGWRDLQMVTKVCEKLCEKLYNTVPIKKLVSLRREMRYMVCETKLNPAARDRDSDDVFIDANALRNIVNRAIQMDCTFCEKSRRECKKCDLYKDLCACYPFELGKPEGEACPLAGATKL